MDKRISTTTWGIALIALGAIFLLGQFVPGIAGFMWGLIWIGVLSALGVWFYGMYRRDTKNWGLLIPAYIMFAIAGLVAMGVFGVGAWLSEFIFPAYVMFAIAAPFLYVYSQDTKNNWWALIPGGIMGMIGAAFMTAVIWQILPVLLIIVGGFILWRNMANKDKAPARTSEPVAASRDVEKKASKPTTPVAEFRPLGEEETPQV